MKRKALLISAALLLFSHGAYSAPLVIDSIYSPTDVMYGGGVGGTVLSRYNEVGDAGDTVGTAQDVSDGTTQIFGSATDNSDVDLFAFSWGGGVLTIDTIGSSFDTQLHLFDALGNGIGENDDGSGLGLQSAISLDLAAGIFLIGVSSFNNDALDAALNPIFGFTNTFDDLGGNLIQGPEGNGPLAGWDNNSGGDAGDYVINFSAAVNAPGGGPTPTPEPGILVLLGLGLAGLGFARRRS